MRDWARKDKDIPKVNEPFEGWPASWSDSHDAFAVAAGRGLCAVALSQLSSAAVDAAGGLRGAIDVGEILGPYDITNAEESTWREHLEKALDMQTNHGKGSSARFLQQVHFAAMKAPPHYKWDIDKAIQV